MLPGGFARTNQVHLKDRRNKPPGRVGAVLLLRLVDRAFAKSRALTTDQPRKVCLGGPPPPSSLLRNCHASIRRPAHGLRSERSTRCRGVHWRVIHRRGARSGHKHPRADGGNDVSSVEEDGV
jgi:hypothetical protein